MVRKTPIIAIVVIFSVWFLLGYTYESLSQQDQDEEESYSGLVGFGMRFPSGETGQTHQVESGRAFEANVWLSHQRPATDYLFTCIVDYRQAPCTWDGETELLHERYVEGNEYLEIPYSTPILDDSFHDFAVLAMSNVRSDDLSDNYRMRTDLSYLYRSRLVFLNRQERPEKFHVWSFEKVSPGETIEYYIHLGNGNAETDHNAYALMAFLDYQQIPIDGGEQWVVFADMEPAAQVTIPAQFTAPEEPGNYELMVAFAYNPFRMLEEPTTGDEREMTPIQQGIYPSVRTAIVVEEPNSP